MSVSVTEDQVVRIACGLFVTASYSGRLVVHGNGPVQILGYDPNSYVVTVVVLLILAVPEIVDRVPLGPSKK